MIKWKLLWRGSLTITTLIFYYIEEVLGHSDKVQQ